jgi:predicted MPP superfamily phosphohydrolase
MRTIRERDFSSLKYFPGTTGNPFDTILHRVEGVERIPNILFAILLLLIAIIFTFPRWSLLLTMGQWSISLLDRALIAELPHSGRSFGPVKAPVLLLAGMRSLVALLLPPVISFPAQIIGTLLVIYGFWIEPHHLRVTRQSLKSLKLHNRQPIRILHLSDLHIERETAREKQLNQLVKLLEPDLILFSGDFLNLSYLKDPLAHTAARAVIKDWSAPYGVFAVTGSPAVDLEEVIPGLLEGLPLHWLQNEKQIVNIRGQEIMIAGITCTHKPFLDGPRLAEVLPDSAERFSILLYHSPDLAPNAARSGFDLQLSGHTHGGQVRLPLVGALFTGSLYGKTFEAGRMQLGSLVLYISRGIGLEGASAPRVRFLCPPEIILWELEAA